MEMAAQTRLGLGLGAILSFCKIFVIADMESACSSPSGFLPSSSCSSYFYCDWLGNPQEGECEEGKFWNKDLEFCDLEENVSCGKGLFSHFKSGSSVVKVGLQLVSIAGVSIANMLGSTDTNNIENENEKDQTFIEQRFGTETKAYPLDPTDTNDIKKENGKDVINGRFGTLPVFTEIREEENKNEELKDFFDKFQHEEYETAGTKTGQQDYSKLDKISITYFVDKDLAVLEQQEETTPFTISRAKQLFLQNNDNNMPRIINKVLEQQEEINPGLTISGAKQPILQTSYSPGILSSSESILLAKVNSTSKSKLSQLTVQTPPRFQTRPSPKISQIPISTQPQSVNTQHQSLSQKPFNLLNTKNFKAFDAQFGGSVPTNPGAAQLTSSIFEATPIKTKLSSKPVEQTIDQPAPTHFNVKVQPSSFYRYPANVI